MVNLYGSTTICSYCYQRHSQRFALIAIKDTVTQDDKVDDNPLSVLREHFRLPDSMNYEVF